MEQLDGNCCTGRRPTRRPAAPPETPLSDAQEGHPWSTTAEMIGLTKASVKVELCVPDQMKSHNRTRPSSTPQQQQAEQGGAPVWMTTWLNRCGHPQRLWPMSTIVLWEKGVQVIFCRPHSSAHDSCCSCSPEMLSSHGFAPVFVCQVFCAIMHWSFSKCVTVTCLPESQSHSPTQWRCDRFWCNHASDIFQRDTVTCLPEARRVANKLSVEVRVWCSKRQWSPTVFLVVRPSDCVDPLVSKFLFSVKRQTSSSPMNASVGHLNGQRDLDI